MPSRTQNQDLQRQLGKKYIAFLSQSLKSLVKQLYNRQTIQTQLVNNKKHKNAAQHIPGNSQIPKILNNYKQYQATTRQKMLSTKQNHLLQLTFQNHQCQILIISKKRQDKWEKFTANIEANFGRGNYVFGIFENQEEMRSFMKHHENYVINFQECSLSLKCSISAYQFKKNVQRKIKLHVRELSQIENLRYQVAFLRKKLTNYEQREGIRSQQKKQHKPSTEKKSRQKTVLSEKSVEIAPEKRIKINENPKKRRPKSPQPKDDSRQKKFKRQNKRIEEMIQLQKRRRIKKRQSQSQEQSSKQPIKRKTTKINYAKDDESYDAPQSNSIKQSRDDKFVKAPIIADIIEQLQSQSELKKIISSKNVEQEPVPQQIPVIGQQSSNSDKNQRQNKSSLSEVSKVNKLQNHNLDSSEEQKLSSDKPCNLKNEQQMINNQEEQHKQEQQQQQQQQLGSQSEQAKKNYISKIKVGDKYKIQFKNGDFYFGHLKKHKFHGKGKYVSKINGTYDGEWVDGRADGFGTTVDIEGNRHEGLYKKDLRHGFGKDWYPNGERYQGNFLNSNKQGYGVYHYNNGDRYQGNWKCDMCDGQGKEIYTNGSYYVGSWAQDQKDGEGKLYTNFGVMRQTYSMGRLIASEKIFREDQ